MLLLVLPLINADSQLIQEACLGDLQLVILCSSVGDNQLGSFFGGDSISPVVSNVAPPDNSEDSDGILEISFNVTDSNPIGNCTLWLDSPAIAEQIDTSITKDVTQVFTVTNPPVKDILDWFVSCTDNFNNQANSTIWQVDTKIGEGNPGGGGGGGGGLIPLVFLNVTEEDNKTIEELLKEEVKKENRFLFLFFFVLIIGVLLLFIHQNKRNIQLLDILMIIKNKKDNLIFDFKKNQGKKSEVSS